MEKENKVFEKSFYILSLLLLISIPFGYFLSSLTFGLWFLFCVFWGIKSHSLKFNRVLAPLLFFSLFSCISILWSQDVSQTSIAILRQLPLLLFAISGMFIPTLLKKNIVELFKKLSIFLCAFAIFILLFALSKYYKYQFKDFLFYHELVSPLDLNAIYVSYIFSTFFLFTLIIINKKQFNLIFVLLILGAFLVLLSSKMILFITSILALLIIAFKIRGPLLKMAVLGTIVVSFLGIFKYAKPIQDRFSTEFNTSYSEIFQAPAFDEFRVYTGVEARMLQMRVFKEIINTPEEGIFGVGLGASKKEIQNIHRRLNTPEVFQTYNFHNQYLQVFAELGFMGLLLLLTILVIGLVKSLKIKIFFPFIILTMTLFLTESVIWRQRGILFFGLLYILLIKVSATSENNTKAV